MRFYTFDELTERYGLSKGGFSKFFHASESKLVKDGVKTYHQNGKKIIFTEEAVEILDEIRGLNKDIILAQKETADEIRVRELLEENSTLKTQLLLIQEESKVDKERIIKLTEENGQVKLLEERDKNKSEQLETFKQERNNLINTNNETSAKLAETQAELSVKEKEVSSAREEMAAMQAQNDELARKYQAMQQQLHVYQETSVKLQESLDAEKNKTLWQRFRDILK